ncbi:hypothetical protein KKG31_07845 [Patescibacteria group bacterium]|nr:hypothetical protein [Patescibacteria group bacterium]MBU1758978.1 hypothetical protein [Patescibacteria group bacterium]
MDQSEKLLTVTTQIMDPNKLKSTDVIITQDAQVKNLAIKEVYLELKDEHFIIDIQDL